MLRVATLLAFALLPLALLQAQSGDSTSRPRITAVHVSRSGVFDSSETSLWYERLANRLHSTTRASRIRRELLLEPGDRFDSTRVVESARNLRRLGIFRDARIDTVTAGDGVALQVTTRDAWTTLPYAEIHSSGGQATFLVSLAERNVAGTATTLAASYRHDTDRDAFAVGWSAPRLIGQRVGLGANWLALSDGHSGGVSASAPFYSIATPTAWSIGATTFDGRVLRYFDGREIVAARLRRRQDIARGDAAIAVWSNGSTVLRASTAFLYRRDDFAPETLRTTIGVTHVATVTPFLSLVRPRYTVVRDFRNMGPPEDLDLGTSLYAGVSLAPDAWGYPESGLGPTVGLTTGFAFPRGFALLSASANRLYAGGSVDSSSASAAATIVAHPAEWHMLLVHGDVGRKRRTYPGGEYDLGLLFGPRAFPAHAFTGDRAFFTTAEYRVTPWRDIQGLIALGIAGFADYGGAWYGTEDRRTGTDFGLGLRIGTTRLGSLAEAARIDVAYRRATDVLRAGWIFSLGGGFPFESR